MAGNCSLLKQLSPLAMKVSESGCEGYRRDASKENIGFGQLEP